MKLRWIALAAAGAALLVRASSRQEKDAEAPQETRRQFARIARLRLVAACPSLDGRIRERDLRETFDWIVAELCRRTGSCDFGALVQWAVREREERPETSAQVSHDAVGRLPDPVLEAIDGCQGRIFAAVLLHESLTEAGRRTLPQLQRYVAASR